MTECSRPVVDIALLVGFLLFTAVVVQGQDEQDDGQSNPNSTDSAIAGFSVVLTLLIVSLCVVILLCACCGKCKLPCKRGFNSPELRSLPVYHTSLSRKTMFPFSSSNSEHVLNNNVRLPVQKHSSLPPRNSLPFNVQSHVSPQEPRARSMIDTQCVRNLPANTSNHNVIHLCQLNSESFEQFTAKCASLKAQQRVSSLKNPTRPPEHDSTGCKSPSIVKSQYVRPVDTTSPPNPGTGFTQETTISYSERNITLTPKTQRGGSEISPVPFLSNVHSEAECSTTESGDDKRSNTILDSKDHHHVNAVITDHRVNVVVSPTSVGGPVKQIDCEISKLSSKSPSPAISVVI